MAPNPRAAECAAGRRPTIPIPADTSNVPITDFDTFSFTAEISPGDARTHTVYVKGDPSRPGVLLMHELPGFTWQCTRLARLIEQSGFRVYVPLLFGAANTNANVNWQVAKYLPYVCISREFTALRGGKRSPITNWLRTLGAHIRAECRGAGVGAVGLCLTGGFALSLLLDDPAVAPALCQPSLPFRPKGDSSYPPDEMATIQRRVAEGAIPVRLYRFADDRKSPAAKADAFEAALPTLLRWDLKGDEHATLTLELREGAETACAAEDLLEYLHQRLDRPPA